MITAIVLAAGFSKRMGANKLLLPIRNKPMVEHIMEMASTLSFKDVIIVSQHQKVLELAKKHHLIAVKNFCPHLGQSFSMKLGICAAYKTSHFMFFTGDQPFLVRENIQILIDKFKLEKKCVVVPTVNGAYKTPTIFSNELKNELLSVTGDQGGRTIIKKYKNYILEVPMADSLSFYDIDTKEEYDYFKNL